MTTRTVYRSPGSTCTRGNCSATSTTSWPTGEWEFGWKHFCPKKRGVSCRFARAEEPRRPGEEYAGALAYLQRMDRHHYEFPFEEFGKMAQAMRRWLDAGGGRQALGDLEELRQAVERVSEYQEFQPQRCDRREINRKLRAAGQEVAA